jgi:two-component system CheB/CheR fusion protein
MPDSNDSNSLGFPVVGIGASAGGLEAFKKFLKAIPPHSGMAYLFIQHMSAEHESLLPEILAKNTPIPVHSISNEVNLTPDNVYVMPPGKLLTVMDGRLNVEDRDQKNKNTKIIDLFFSSLAVVHQSFAVGVVLSGTASDGTLGLKTIKAYGGLTFAQDQSSAFEGMPQSAIRSGDVDFILPPEQIPSKLMEINLPFRQIPIKETGKEASSEHDEEILKQMLILLKNKKNVDFSQYKKTTITRRIVRRMALNKIKDIEIYLELLKKNKAELDLLYNDFLISVTNFFRDPKTFQALTKEVFPALLKERKTDDAVRIWVAGCATGQEAYSLAIGLQEFIKNRSSGLRVQVFATDISQSAISKARNGIYDKIEIEGLPNDLIDQYFTRRDGQYFVIKEIREMCIFAYHNLLNDPPFARMDLVSCRNVLIYMDPILQKRAFAAFHYALKDNGFLLLGKSESIGTNPAFKLLSGFEAEVKLYTKKGLSRPGFPVASRRMEEGLQVNDKMIVSKNNMSNFQKTADELILSRYSPPGVIINEQYDIVQFRGLTGRWLEPAPGRASLNLLKMAREGLSFELRNILHKVKQENMPAIKEDLSFVSGEKKESVTIEAISIPGEESYYLVLFHSRTPNDTPTINSSSRAEHPAEKTDQKSVAELRVEQLERELSIAREDMRSITEEQEASNEELQSANEELLSTTEELQTLNEELQTSNEEVQSTNEELQTLNQELLDRNNQLNLTNQYVEAIIDTIRDPIVILDKDLRVRTASRGFYQRFNTTEAHAEGNLIFELKSCPWADSALIEKLREVALYEKGIIDYEVTFDVPPVGKRIYSMNATKFQRIAGDPLILISMEDVTVNRMERTSLVNANSLLEASNQNLSEFAYVASHDLQEPLRKINTYSQHLKEKNYGEQTNEVYDYLNKITGASKRMNRLIEDLLNYARLQNAEDPKVPADLRKIAEVVVRDFELEISQSHAVIEIGDLPTIQAIPLRMSQLFHNLLSNSLKFMPPARIPRISIKSTLLNETEKKKMNSLNQHLNYYQIIFKDNGIGFNPDFSEKIFSIFQRLNGRTEYEGTGIGLTICRKIVQNHDGLIFAKSKENEGSEFKIILPVSS